MAKTQPAPPAASPWLRWGLPLLVFVLAFLPFTPALGYGFVQLDDDRNFDARFNPWFNEGAHDLSAERLEWMFTANHLGHYQPLTWVSLALDTKLSGRFDPRDFHRTNLVLHALNALLVFVLALALLRLARGSPAAGDDLALRLGALAAALSYGLHPLRVESVAWVTERRDVLSTAFLLGSVLAYLRFVRAESARLGWMGLALVCFVLSLFSKAWGITLPAVLLVLDVYPLRRRAGDDPTPWSGLLLEKLGFVAFALVAAALAARAQGETLALVSLAEHGLLQRTAQAAFGLGFYLYKTLVPIGLSPLYLLEADLDPFAPRYLAGLAAVLVLSAGLIALRRRFPAGLAAWVCYALLVSPVLGFLQSGAQVAADRYTYIAALPFSLLVGALVVKLCGARQPGASPARPLAVGAAVLVVAGVLGTLARAQTRVWEDSESVYARVVEIEPDNYFGQHCLSVVLRQEGRLDEALEHARASVVAHPNKGNEEARFNMGQLLRMNGEPEAALEAFRGALEVAPDHMSSLRELVNEHLRARRHAEAVALIEASLARAPGFLDGYAELARVQVGAGRLDLAEQAWRRALAANSAWPAANHAVGLAALAQGDAPAAERWFMRAMASGIHDFEHLVDLGRAYQAQGRTAEAASCYQQVLAYQPQHPRARALLQGL